MKPITQKEIKNQLIKIIRKHKIVDVIYEPRYSEDFSGVNAINGKLIGSTITIRTE